MVQRFAVQAADGGTLPAESRPDAEARTGPGAARLV